MSDNDFQSIFDSDEDGLLDTPAKAPKLTSSDRLERSFLEIIEFYREHRRIPRSDTSEIAERKLGARLDGILANENKIAALNDLDEFGLLHEPEAPASLDDLLGGDDFGLLDDDSGLLDTSDLPARARRIDPNEVAQRVKSSDFGAFEPLFRQKHEELRAGLSKLVSFGAAGGQRAIKEGGFFVLSGVMLFVAEITEPKAAPGVRTRYKPRTRTVFENGTESNLYRRSLAGQLYENGGLAVVPATFEELLADDEATGYIYVLRSLSDDPQIQEVPDLHKIGFSRGPVEKRIAHAQSEATYLMAPVEIVASYRTYNLKISALEHLLHRVFSEKRLRLSQVGKDGRVYEPSEWYSVPLKMVNQAIDLITSGDIVDYEYDAEARELRLRP
ncbi:GIY-YIG nuclease family protein [Curtobacterium sp. CFBP9011]|uniref:GIY-YIG nuclease family protein n=1 Tax=Curtobacterium sp. CFBP9011 TaxID=3096530 RepID=UPI002A6B7C53|nr:GIY-YIG nuclease family protein [Curtobacterium sp. CFBP9011]MDY1006340.1 GIY-YIG nuclease family protein [Curtobacterium sp. CFBP9011]